MDSACVFCFEDAVTCICAAALEMGGPHLEAWPQFSYSNDAMDLSGGGGGGLDWPIDERNDFTYDGCRQFASLGIATTDLQNGLYFQDVPYHSIDPSQLTNAIQPTLLTTNVNVTPISQTSSHYTQPRRTPRPTKRARHKYTPEDKARFVQWITSNPKPDRYERVRFARSLGVGLDQLNARISNWKRDSKPVSAAKRKAKKRGLNTSVDSPSPTLWSTVHGTNTSMASSIQENDVDGIIQAASCELVIVQPVPENNLSSHLPTFCSYSALQVYLQSPEESSCWESVQCALDRLPSKTVTEILQKTLSVEMPGGVNKGICYICENGICTGQQTVMLPCERWLHKTCATQHFSRWFSEEICAVCGQSILEGLQDRCPPLASHQKLQIYCGDTEDPCPAPSRYILLGDDDLSSEVFLESPSSAPNFRRGDATWSSVDVSEASSDTSVDSAYSYPSSASRFRAKKMQKERCMSVAPRYTCSLCNEIFVKSSQMLYHELEKHILPQRFPCTFCELSFTSHEEWEKHEALKHCEFQLTWFSVLDRDSRLKECMFCECSMPNISHYERVHSIGSCNSPHVDQTFITKQYLMTHLFNPLELIKSKPGQTSGSLQPWFPLKLNIKINREGDLWRCGYCGIVGLDWDNRTKHIIHHWEEGGPRFTKEHRWSSDLASMSSIHYRYFKHLEIGAEDMVEWKLSHQMEKYEAEMRYRASDYGHCGHTSPPTQFSTITTSRLGKSLAKMDIQSTRSAPRSLAFMDDKMEEVDTADFVHIHQGFSKVMSSVFALLAERNKLRMRYAEEKRAKSKACGKEIYEVQSRTSTVENFKALTTISECSEANSL